MDKRLDADAPLGFLLSGGLDSSLVCAISAVILGKKIRTFAIGMDTDAIDLKYAREAADFMGADHTEVYMTRDEVIETLPEVIADPGHLGHHHHPGQHGHVPLLQGHPPRIPTSGCC